MGVSVPEEGVAVRATPAAAAEKGVGLGGEDLVADPHEVSLGSMMLGPNLSVAGATVAVTSMMEGTSDLLPTIDPVSFAAGFACLAALAFLCMGRRSADVTGARPRSKQMRKWRGKTFIAPYPNGWYKICNSVDLKAGEVKYFQYCGQHLAVYRGADSGTVQIFDAFCPHLGANMAMGGRVCGDDLVCPFHEWKFNKEGVATDIPYLPTGAKIPKNAKARVHPGEERYGMIFWWFHADKEEPSWFIPPMPEVDDGRAVYYGGKAPQDVNMHVQDWPENGVDFAHFPILHAEMMVPWTKYKVPFIKVHHEPEYKFDEEQPHMSYFITKSCLGYGDKRWERTKATATIHFIGNCGVVFMTFDIPDVGRIYLVECHTPREQMVLKTDWQWFAEKHIPRALVSYVVGNWYSQWQNDLEIWENKVYKRPPIILKGDGPVNKFRRWYSQFYSESSERVAKESSALDW